ncbi:MAG: hypothetical protein QXF17_07095, partial [Ignisphaera sp.]
SKDIEGEVEWAVNRWNTAITYFGYRYLWLDVLNYRLKISKDVESCNVFFKLLDSPPRGCPIKLSDKEWRPVAVVNFYPEPKGRVEYAIISIWKEMLRDDLREDLKKILLHEFSWILGLYPFKYGGELLGLASDTIGTRDVTSLDVYGLHLRSKIPEEELLKKVKYISVDRYVPVLTIEEAVLSDILSSIIALVSAYGLWRMFRRFENVQERS